MGCKSLSDAFRGLGPFKYESREISERCEGTDGVRECAERPSEERRPQELATGM